MEIALISSLVDLDPREPNQTNFDQLRSDLKHCIELEKRKIKAWESVLSCSFHPKQKIMIKITPQVPTSQFIYKEKTFTYLDRNFTWVRVFWKIEIL